MGSQTDIGKKNCDDFFQSGSPPKAQESNPNIMH